MDKPASFDYTSGAKAGLQQQRGAILVPLLIVAILIVLVLMWQSGMFDGSATPTSANDTASSETAAQQADPSAAESGTTAEPVTALPDRPLTPSEQAALRAKNYQPSPERVAAGTTTEFTDRTGVDVPPVRRTDSADEAAIDLAAQALLANNRPDFSACENGVDANAILECAAQEQTRVLQAAFAEHNAQRSAGDAISLEYGGVIMQQVIDGLQAALEPYVQAANRP